MAFTQISTSVTIINSGLIGYCGISLTNYSTSAVSAIASGSGVEIAGAFFKADGDITINASSWTAITTATTAYLQLVPSGTAGSQTIAASWTSSTPVWSTSKQGWYATAASTTRVIGTAYKNGATSQWYKNLQLAEGNSHGIATFTNVGSDTWFSPVNRIWVTGCAAGTNGAAGSAAGGIGGAGGAWLFKSPYEVSQGTVYTISIGASGTSTSIVGVVTCSSATIAGGAAGYNGNAGFSSGGMSPQGGSDGGGGGGSLGSGGHGGLYGASTPKVGSPGGYGAGGGGGGGGPGSVAGGTGGSAILVIEW